MVKSYCRSESFNDQRTYLTCSLFELVELQFFCKRKINAQHTLSSRNPYPLNISRLVRKQHKYLHFRGFMGVPASVYTMSYLLLTDLWSWQRRVTNTPRVTFDAKILPLSLLPLFLSLSFVLFPCILRVS